MNWRKIGHLLRFDLYYSLTRLRAWVFLAPFSLYWFLVFYYMANNRESIDKISSREAVGLLQYYGAETTLNLFVNHPVSISLPYMLLLVSTPLFMVLAAYGQFSADLRSGFLRFLTTRTTRLEIFTARFLAAFIPVLFAFVLISCISVIFSINHDGFPVLAVISYAIQTCLALLLYALPFIALMSLFSAMFSSQIAVLFMGGATCITVYLFYVFALLTNDVSMIAFILPIALMKDLAAVDSVDFYSALAILPVYLVVFSILAFKLVDRRNF